jgi:hypothetical protein
MITESLTYPSDKLRCELLPRLCGRVFHVTSHSRCSSIRADGEIRSGIAGGLAPNDRYDNAYFRSIDCVSLCDLRTATDGQIAIGLDAYYFLNPDGLDSSPVFLFLAPDHYSKLIPGRRQMEERALCKLVVPHIEVGYPGSVPLGAISEVWVVTVVHPPLDDYSAALIEFSKRKRK